jgi:tRNA threonylcarbamoyladenosine biosynthesis protein TsaB
MELSIDTASELASIALSRDGRVQAEHSWRCERNHTVELLPAIDKLLVDAGVRQSDLTAVFVSLGPGMYTGLRVGISVAQGLARALSIPALGAGRLELDAYPHAAFAGPIVAVHRAGRGELAWATYVSNPWRELAPPALSKPEQLSEVIPNGALVTGEVDEALAILLRSRASIAEPPTDGRARSLAALAHPRLKAGETAEPALLRPIYLRPPAHRPSETVGPLTTDPQMLR